MTEVLRNQVQSAQDTALQIAQRDAMTCYAVEELIDVSLGLFEAAKLYAERVRQRATPSDTEESVQEFARSYLELCHGIDRLFESVLQGAAGVERKGYVIAGVDRLVGAKSELGKILSIPLNRVIISEGQLAAGKTRPLGEVRDELRRRHHS